MSAFLYKIMEGIWRVMKTIHQYGGYMEDIGQEPEHTLCKAMLDISLSLK